MKKWDRLFACTIPLFLLIVMMVSQSSHARVPTPVDRDYEDTVRIVLLYNTPLGRGCLGNPPPVGIQTRDFIVSSLDTNFVKNVKILPAWNCVPEDRDMPDANRCTNPATVQMIENLWPGKLPHVIVHSNAGWAGWNGPNMMDILRWAVRNYIGIVEIGDDAGPISAEVFGLTMRSGWPGQMQTATWLNNPGDSLMLKIQPSRDRLVDPSMYPGLNGVIINASQLLGHSTFNFKPYAANGRCEADADDWGLSPEFANKVVFLGYQQGYNNASNQGDISGAPVGYIGAADQWSILAALQDTITTATGRIIRRGVALSLQPQYLQHTIASQQMVYDAIMYASLAHTLQPRAVQIKADADTIEAGTSTVLRPTILPADLPPATKERLAQTVIWRLDSARNQPGSTLSSSVGTTVSVSGTRAFRNIYVIASLYDSIFKKWVYDTAAIYVKPAPDHQVWIELGNPVTKLTEQQVHPRTYRDSVEVRVLESISLDSAQMRAYAYAVVRDRFGNYKRLAGSADWASNQPSIIGAQPTSGIRWEGELNRVAGASGTAFVRAFEPNLIPDTVAVIVQAGSLLEMRIVDQSNTTLTAVTMNTDQTQYFKVQGRWSDNPNQWVDVPASWAFTPDTMNPRPPIGQVTEWTFDPTKPGTASLRASAGNRTATVMVTVVAAPPSRVEITLLDNNPVAGVPFKAVVRVYNSDGLVPGQWCDEQAIFQDVLTNPSQRDKPTVSTLFGTGGVNQRPDSTNRVKECFIDGVDTVSFTLFYAPVDLSQAHNLFVRLHSARLIEGSTGPFNLRPGPLARVVIGNEQCSPVEDLTLQAPDGVILAQLCGFDRYENRLGTVDGRWSSDGSLTPPNPGPTPLLHYFTTDVRGKQEGYIIATSVANPSAKDSIRVTILPPKARYTALTQDSDGNGYLDKIVITVNRRVVAPDPAQILITNRDRTVTDSLRVASVTMIEGDSVFAISLTELRNGKPQTGWRPSIVIAGHDELSNLPIIANDGAAPVIWRVVREVKDARNPAKDIVTITFSEPLRNKIGPADNVSLILNVWTGSDTNSSVDTLLNDINNFNTQAGNDSRIAVFTLSNGKRLTSAHYLSIDSSRLGPAQVVDSLYNKPLERNRRTQVEVINAPIEVFAVPNPFSPRSVPENHGRILTYIDPEKAIAMTKQGGIAIIIDVPLPSSENSTMNGSIAIYDLAGNLVNYRSSGSKNLFQEARETTPSFWQPGNNQRLGFFWDGYNDKGYRIRPGAYRAIVTFVIFDGVKSSSTVRSINLGATK